MAGNAFGFQPYPQRPTVDPKTVGAALQRRAQAQQGPTFEQENSAYMAQLAAQARAADPDKDQLIYEGRAGLMGQGLAGPSPYGTAPRGVGGSMAAGDVRPMAMPGFAPDATAVDLDGPDGGSQDEDSATQAARADAKRRIGNGLARPQQQQPAAPFAAQQLSRMGLSPTEQRLLKLSGGTK